MAYRICEVRRFVRSYIVYVNRERDIKLLKKNKKFKVHSIFKEKNKVIGMEFYFDCKVHTLFKVKAHIDALLRRHRRSITYGAYAKSTSSRRKSTHKKLRK